MLDLSFNFSDKCWLWQSKATAWHFITLPQDKSEEVKFFNENMHEKTRGWGVVRVRVQVTIGESSWLTSIFPSTQYNAYILPIKADVRKKEKIAAGDLITVKLTINI